MSEASLIRRLEARREEILATLQLPAEGLPGSLSQVRRRCGSTGCHCHEEGGHPSWSLTYMFEGKKCVDHVSKEQVEEVQRRMEEGNAYKAGVAELMAINARLLVLRRRARRQQKAAARRKGR